MKKKMNKLILFLIIILFSKFSFCQTYTLDVYEKCDDFLIFNNKDFISSKSNHYTSQSFVLLKNGYHAKSNENNFTKAEIGDCNTDSNSIFVEIYPNPSLGEFKIEILPFETIINQIVNVMIFDTNNRLILNRKINYQESLIFDISEYSSGVYYVKLISNKISKNFKIIKQ
jgi:hypothetical protein